MATHGTRIPIPQMTIQNKKAIRPTQLPSKIEIVHLYIIPPDFLLTLTLI